MPAEPPVVSPRSLDAAYALLAGASHRPLAGGTDLLVQVTGEAGPPPERVLDLWRIDALRGIRVADGSLELGALTTYAQILRSSPCATHVPALVEAAATIGAAQIQNRGTLGGNIANASPAGDTLPVLLALDAVVVVGGARGEREVPAAEFWPAYRKTALAPDELVLRVRFPIVDGREQRFRKVGTRRAQAISKIVAALAWRQAPGDDGGRRWRDVRIAFGSMAPTPIRATGAEAALEGAAVDQAGVERAVAALRAELHPIDDVRSTAAYRFEVSCRILGRLLEEAT